MWGKDDVKWGEKHTGRERDGTLMASALQRKITSFHFAF